MKKPPVIHPLLFAVFPILFLYAHNVSKMSGKQIILLTGASLGLALFLWVLLGLLLRDRVKSGIATSIMVSLLLTYGHFYGYLEEWGILVPGHGYLLPGALLAFGYCVYFIRQARSDFATTNRILNVAAAAVVAINAFTVLSSNISMAQARPPRPSPEEQIARPPAKSLPDIYLIVLDEYAHPDIMREYYDYDNDDFVKNLEGRGFFVAGNSTMDNTETIRAVASILNMERTPETEPREVSYERITNNRVVDYVRSLGYKYVYFGQWYEVGRYKIEADSYFNYYETDGHGPLTPEFSAVFWNTTILRPFHKYILGDYYEGYYREGMLRTLDQLAKAPEMEGPKFVYAHIMAGHTPFVFGPKGERVAPANYYDSDDRQYYLGQYVNVTGKIDRVIGELLKKSASDPIIIVQSDHGPRWLDGWNRVLNAYHLPGDGNQLLDDAVSPVDTFRIIFNHYFGANFELFEDAE